MDIFSVENEPREVTEIREKILNKFQDLLFVEESHQYFLNGEELPSVSHITHRFQEPFDELIVAENYALKNGETPQYWLDKWHFNSLKAMTTGTLVHSFGEANFYKKINRCDLIPKEVLCKFDKKHKWLIPTRTKEEAVLKFWEEFPKDLYPVLAETKVYKPHSYAGTFDLLAYYKHPTDDSKSGLVILDYKTNAKLEDEYSRNVGRMLYEPFSDLYSESKSLYTLQLSCYQIPLEDLGLKVIGRRLIWLTDDGNYELIPLIDVTKKLRKVLV